MFLTNLNPLDLAILLMLLVFAGFALVNLWRAAIRRREQRRQATRQPWIQMRLPDDQR